MAGSISEALIKAGVVTKDEAEEVAREKEAAIRRAEERECWRERKKDERKQIARSHRKLDAAVH